ncbi:peptidase S41 [Nitritalea halalkaliphila LW7]|uniref:Tricorn protease homolog n=1 Tax=Nitritalea halalkaliphila LW7 TaxID=1189621 RepID=I5CA04_9BACT|nr:S41 family peptidase [Nitritalea halalkaliphila]EIM78656.1 peptidase S41 [Nitritalea halalkaliphila LW7]
MRKIVLSICILLLGWPLFAQQEALWLRYPALSPDGEEIVFSYKGDLFKVSASGGLATPLTLHDAHDFMPVWSPDGREIAFASDRFGNFDVFIMSAAGGPAKRLTHHSTNDFPWTFSPDGSDVFFGSGRNDLASSARFPNKGLFMKLYRVSKTGGRNYLISTAGMQSVSLSPDGRKIVFQDRKGYEDEWRKRHTSSVTRDIWLYDRDAEQYTQISDFEGEDREPLLSADGSTVFYLSEKNGSQNIFSRKLSSGEEKQLTRFEDHPVRHLSRSRGDKLAFSWNGALYTLEPGAEPQRLQVQITGDFSGSDIQTVSVRNGATGMALSPNGKEIAFVFRGEVFVTSVAHNFTKRITSTPAQERTLSWGKDGRSLYYATERDGKWDIFRARIQRDDEQFFHAATLITEEPVIASDKDEFQPVVSPDGKKIAYLEERNILKVFDLDKKSSVTLIEAGQNFSYSDGDQDYAWSPDSRWVVAKNALGHFGSSHMVKYAADGSGTPAQLTFSGFSDGNATWAMGGKAIFYTNDQDGKKPLAFQGAREVDIYAMFFDQDTYDQFRLSKEEYELRQEMKKKDKDDKEKKEEKKDEPLTFDLARLEERMMRLTPGSVNLSSFEVSPKGDKVYMMARYEKGYDVWELDTRTRELKALARLGGGGGSLKLDDEGKNLFVLSGGNISKIETANGKVSRVGIDAEMELNLPAEREYIYHHAWRQVKKKFYDPELHGIDWEMYRDAYEKFLPHINNNYDFQELLSELLGELNGSHTGGRYSPRSTNGDATASLGLFFDEMSKEDGLIIEEVIAGGPLDNAETKIKAGHRILKIDGVALNQEQDWNALLNRKAGKRVLLSMFNPETRESWEEVVLPISGGAENNLLYERWVKMMRDRVAELSGGKLGYVHVRGMNDGSYRTVYSEVLGRNIDKEALIVDTRFNGGGWLHEDLSNFLDGKPYATFRPYGFVAKGGEPRDKWSKPSVVLMSESNYSDAHAFPYAYRAKGIGKLIGMPVPGTSTAVWWETQIDPTLVFGIPMIAFYGVAEDRPLENLQLEPDIKVATPFEEILKGEDAQLRTAVQTLLEELEAKK